MKGIKALFLILALFLLAFAGCSEAADTAKETGDAADNVVAEATEDFVGESDTVEIGEMLSS